MLRWTTGALWGIHGVWVLLHQIERFLVGEGLVGVAELGAAILIVQGMRACDVLAIFVSLLSGLLAVIYLTKGPVVMDAYSLMAFVSLVAMLFTIAISLCAILRPGASRSPGSHEK